MDETDREELVTDKTSEDARDTALRDAELGEVTGGAPPLAPFGRRGSPSVEQIERFIH